MSNNNERLLLGSIPIGHEFVVFHSQGWIFSGMWTLQSVGRDFLTEGKNRLSKMCQLQRILFRPKSFTLWSLIIGTSSTMLNFRRKSLGKSSLRDLQKKHNLRAENFSPVYGLRDFIQEEFLKMEPNCQKNFTWAGLPKTSKWTYILVQYVWYFSLWWMLGRRSWWIFDAQTEEIPFGKNRTKVWETFLQSDRSLTGISCKNLTFEDVWIWELEVAINVHWKRHQYCAKTSGSSWFL